MATNEKQLRESISDLEKLEKQLENSSFFNHTVLSQFAKRINENESFLYGLIDYLIDKANLSTEELKGYVSKVRNEMQANKEDLHPGVGLRLDKKEEENQFVPVNCEERLPICQAVCCKLNFALSPEEVESGKVKWELGHPYFIRQDHRSGYCTHIQGENKCCSIYNDRPKVCQRYSCAKDKRIWKDFDNMILNTEWIEKHTGAKKNRIFSM